MHNNLSTMLVADDEPSVQSLLNDIFTKEGYNVLLAGNGQEALEKYQSYHPELILLDIRMPGMDGLEAFTAIRKENKDVMIIIMTAHATIETAVQAMKMGAFDYIIKPFNLEELKVIIKKALQMNRITTELTSLRQEFAEKYTFNQLDFSSLAMREVLHQVELSCQSDVTILLRGESGTGKDVLARYIHAQSPWTTGSFTKINCGALPESLVESELFGHEKGAFTGAISRKQGKFELAQGGTLFLDEIGEVSPRVQVKLLQALQYKEFERVGGTETLKVNCRIIAATNKNLEEAITQKEFREDLYYRLSVFPIHLPPLRNRKEDIPTLVKHFLHSFCSKLNKPLLEVDHKTMDILCSYGWPGNIRELENVVERLVILTVGSKVSPLDLPQNIYGKHNHSESLINPPQDRSLKEVMNDIEKQIIKKILQETGGNRSKTAEKLGISRRNLHYKLVEYQLTED